jgi:hypothetical protein
MHSCASSAYILTYSAVLTIVHLNSTSILSLYSIKGIKAISTKLSDIEISGIGVSFID